MIFPQLIDSYLLVICKTVNLAYVCKSAISNMSQKGRMPRCNLVWTFIDKTECDSPVVVCALYFFSLGRVRL